MRHPVPAPTFQELISTVADSPAVVQRIFSAGASPTPGGRYRHWHKLRFLKPPGQLSHEEWWLGIKFARSSLLKPLPLVDANGTQFRVGMPDPLLQMLQCIDRDASGRIEITEQVTNPGTRDRYLVSSLIDEAITSSQLEGAATTYKMAKDLIRSGRRPRDRNERMILNNYRTMRQVRRLKDRPLTIDLVLEIQRMLTENTLDDPSAVGRFRTSDETVAVWDTRDATILHTPPPADQLFTRMQTMCDFANGKTPRFYIHPVVRSILLHFWLAYDHPFVDGNGRTARALFYLSMLRNGYWLCEYLSISSVVKRSPGKYMRAYLYSESDENDATYFVLFHLRVIQRAIEHLHDFLRRKMVELREVEKMLRSMAILNHRQVALLSHALRHPDAIYSIQSHRNSHNVVYQTARADLIDLVKRGLLEKRRMGRRFAFHPPGDLGDRVASA